MQTQILTRQFETIGARLKIEDIDDIPVGFRRRRVPSATDFTIDIGNDRKGEYFSLMLGPRAEPALELAATDIRPKERHLLLLAKRLDLRGDQAKSKFLCGHDERHWFVAAVPDTPGIASVAQAMEALKPEAARRSQRVNGVKAKASNHRANAGFVRQGEWFFLPRPSFSPARAAMILRDEPIMRSGGKPHMIEELYREGGETVYVCSRHPFGVSQKQYDQLLKTKRDAKAWDWRPMRRNPTVYARGKVRHPDHATVLLPFWHIVVMSAEMRAARVAFLD